MDEEGERAVLDFYLGVWSAGKNIENCIAVVRNFINIRGGFRAWYEVTGLGAYASS
jgi:hypothetical protein